MCFFGENYLFKKVIELLAHTSYYLLDIPVDGILTSAHKSFVRSTKAPTSQERTGSLRSSEGTGMARSPFFEKQKRSDYD